jgi:adenine-specific DNA-methyltransferase
MDAAAGTDPVESDEYLTRQLITYIGNKRSLLAFIGSGLAKAGKKLNKGKLDIFDVFSGSGAVSRYLKRYARKLVVNDIEKYAQVINECYLANKSSVGMEHLKVIHREIADKLKTRPLRDGFIHEMYAPKSEDSIVTGERAFYTERNARFLDTARQYLDEADTVDRRYFLAPLLSEASIHANTSGVFKGFYKNSETGIGEFGGKNKDALSRIKGDIEFLFPLFSNFECEVIVHRGDSNKVVDYVDEVDVAYLDPPYNQHPYGSNYFMLNLLVDYIKPRNVSRVSGIPDDWHRSDYNKSKKAHDALESLVEKIKAKYLLISFNSEGFIGWDDMMAMLKKIGKVEVLETKYNTFRGSRNLADRDIHVKEYLYLVEKS